MRGKQGWSRRAAIAAALVFALFDSAASFGQAFINSYGTFSATSQSQDFYFSLPSASNNLILRTYQHSGGTDVLGGPWPAGGVDSTLTLFTAAGSTIAANDDISATNRDSLLSYLGSGTTLLSAQPLGDYRLRLATFNGGLSGNGLWVTDVQDANHSLVLTAMQGTSQSTISSLQLGSKTAGLTATLRLSTGSTLAVNPNGTVWMREGGLLEMEGGSLQGNLIAFDSSNTVSTINSGTVSANSFSIGQSYNTGTVVLNDGHISANSLFINFHTGGNMYQNGGSISVGTFEMSYGAGGGGGRYTMNGGSLDVSASMAIASGGFNEGAFTQSGGVVSTPSLVVGGFGLGTYTQSGGYFFVNGPGGVTIGDTPQSASYFGVMNFSGGAFLTTDLHLKNGAVFVNSGGYVSASGLATVEPGGSLTVQGGQLDVGSLTVAAGGKFNFSSGTVGITGSHLAITTGGLFGGNYTLGLGRSIVVSQPQGTIINSGSVLEINGGLLSTGFLANFGTFKLTSGTLELTDGDLGIGSGLFDGDLQLSTNQHISTHQSMVVLPGATLYLAGGSVSTLNGSLNLGEIKLSGGLSAIHGGPLDNRGPLSGNGSVDADLQNSSFGTVRVLTGNALTFHGNSNLNAGKMQLLGGLLAFDQTLTNASTGSISGHGSIIAAGLDNDGSLLFSSGNSEVYSPIHNNSGGKVIVTGGANSTFYEAVSTQAGSEFRVSTGSTATFFDNVTGTGQFTGGGTRIFEASASLGAITGTGSTIVDHGASLHVTALTDNTLEVRGAAQITPKTTANDPSSLSTVRNLTIEDDGALDLANNSMVIDYDGASPLLAIRQQLQSGFNNGAWNGEGIISSSAAADHSKALGYRDNSDTIKIQYVYSGDANLDGVVNVADLMALASHWNTSGHVWTTGDFNYDGIVNQIDLGYLALNWSTGAGAPALGVLLTALDLPDSAAVPEPATIAAGLFGTLLATRRRR